MTKAKGDNNSRFTLDMAPELRTRLKIAAAHKGVTMREYCLSAIKQQLAREEPGVLAFGDFNLEALEKVKGLQESVFGERALGDESAELIRQARQERISRQ